MTEEIVFSLKIIDIIFRERYFIFVQRIIK